MNDLKKMKLPTLLFTLILLVTLATGTMWHSAVQAASKNKKVGFAGDPAKKRGIEYGYDKGYAAGKEDNAAGLKADPKRHDSYNNPDKFFRSEFGSQGSFVAGFKSGFNGGYQKAYGRKVKIISAGSLNPSGEGEENPKSVGLKTKPASSQNDAL